MQTESFMRVLADRHGVKMTVIEIAKCAGYDADTLLQVASILAGANRVSREKVSTGVGRAFYNYYMTDEQKEAFEARRGQKRDVKPRIKGLSDQELAERERATEERRQARMQEKEVRDAAVRRAAHIPEGAVVVSKDAANITARLRFLYHLRDRTIFSEWEILKEIITDYEVTLKKATA